MMPRARTVAVAAGVAIVVLVAVLIWRNGLAGTGREVAGAEEATASDVTITAHINCGPPGIAKLTISTQATLAPYNSAYLYKEIACVTATVTVTQVMSASVPFVDVSLDGTTAGVLVVQAQGAPLEGGASISSPEFLPEGPATLWWSEIATVRIEVP